MGLNGPVRVAAGVVAGFGIGVVAAVMGVAGGELLILTIITIMLLYIVDIRPRREYADRGYVQAAAPRRPSKGIR
ncbi:hypothetical protein ACFYP4_28705 [Streptomyces sp. NPDC005551]|uniref:hypothetical protein n=1 Tax=Streptomyces sp. NPDC005551 TaxID=3364725 RepID=UPI0036B70459